VTLNLGSDHGASVREVVSTVRRVTERDVSTLDADRRAGDPPVLIASSEAARRVLGWKPQFGDLETVVETAWTWRQRFPEGYEQ
jgi:UDP-glucose 4-epimerase